MQLNQPYEAKQNTFTFRWEVWRGRMLMGVFGTQSLAREYADMQNKKAGTNV